ncbi:MAG TPA: hypothetical protein VFE48_25455 [Methylomirabilota bacterium]|nr:hypothetical protein [Methylomirabilota bacterium]
MKGFVVLSGSGRALCLDSPGSPRSAILVPVYDADAVTVFPTIQQAEAAIRRTKRISYLPTARVVPLAEVGACS